MKLDRSIQPEEGDDDVEMPVEAEMPLARKIETPLVAGLPFKPGSSENMIKRHGKIGLNNFWRAFQDTERNLVIMHHAGVHTGITELVPGMEVLVAVHEAARIACVEMRRCLEDCLPDVGHLSHSVQCAVWKSIHVSPHPFPKINTKYPLQHPHHSTDRLDKPIPTKLPPARQIASRSRTTRLRHLD